MIDYILITLILVILAYKMGYKKAATRTNNKHRNAYFRLGFLKGKEHVRHEIDEILLLPDDDVIEHLRNISSDTYKKTINKRIIN